MANGTELAKAYVQIVPSAKGIKGNIEKEISGEMSNAGKSGGGLLGSNLVSALKGVLVAAGIGKIIQSSLTAGGDLQQSFGGLETIYGEAADAAKKYAQEAAKAGISANDYAEQAVSFGASLKQAFSGDTTAAVEAANVAIMDMTDNAAKMGTPIENIQSAYQGFAKQNYTMLDNLKLGYGGTKTEMERLLADAQKLSGVEYNIDNLGDVYQAIHVIQEDLGLTGVAAAEASETFTGSFGAMQASLTNFLGALSTGGDVSAALQSLIDSTGAFLMNNLIPMVGQIVSALPEVLITAIPLLLDAGTKLFMSLVDSVTTIGPQVWSALTKVISDMAGKVSPDAVKTGLTTALNLVKGILNALPQMIKSAGELANEFLKRIMQELPTMLKEGADIVTQIYTGITGQLPQIISAASQVMQNLLQTLLSNLPSILESGVKAVTSMVAGMTRTIPQIASAAGQMMGSLLKTIASNLPQLLQSGIELIAKLAAGIIQSIPDVIRGILNLITSVKQEFSNVDWGSVGRSICEGVANGLRNAGHVIMDAALNAAKGAFDTVKSFFGIASPSRLMRDEVGAMMAEGMAIGFEDNVPTKEIQSALKPIANVVPETLGGNQYSYGGFSINVYGAPGQDVRELADIIEDRINGHIRRQEAAFA